MFSIHTPDIFSFPFRSSLNAAVLSPGFCCLMCKRLMVFKINSLSHFKLTRYSCSLSITIFGIEILGPFGVVPFSLHLDRKVCCCFHVAFLLISSKIMLKIGSLFFSIPPICFVETVGFGWKCIHTCSDRQ